MKDFLTVVTLSLLIFGGLAAAATVATGGVRQIGPDGEVVTLPGGQPWSDPASQAAHSASNAALAPTPLPTVLPPAASFDATYQSAKGTAAEPARDLWPGERERDLAESLYRSPGMDSRRIITAAAVAAAVILLIGALVRGGQVRSRSRATAALHQTVSAPHVAPPAVEAFHPRPDRNKVVEAQVRRVARRVGRALAELGYFYQDADSGAPGFGFRYMTVMEEQHIVLLDVDLDLLPPWVRKEDLLAEQTVQHLMAALRCRVEAIDTPGVMYVLMPR